MRKSARVIGQEYGLTAQEMNFILKENGILDGEPGAYYVTEKGEQYADEHYHKRGTGGYAQYNRSWTTITYDDSIEDVLDFSAYKKEEIRQAMAAAKTSATGSMADIDDEAAYDHSREDTVNTTSGHNDASIKAAAAILSALALVGIYKATPHIKRWWHDDAAPFLRNAGLRVQEKLRK